jgi:hypothetical protein
MSNMGKQSSPDLKKGTRRRRFRRANFQFKRAINAAITVARRAWLIFGQLLPLQRLHVPSNSFRYRRDAPVTADRFVGSRPGSQIRALGFSGLWRTPSRTRCSSVVRLVSSARAGGGRFSGVR